MRKTTVEEFTNCGIAFKTNYNNESGERYHYIKLNEDEIMVLNKIIDYLKKENEGPHIIDRFYLDNFENILGKIADNT